MSMDLSCIRPFSPEELPYFHYSPTFVIKKVANIVYTAQSIVETLYYILYIDIHHMI